MKEQWTSIGEAMDHYIEEGYEAAEELEEGALRKGSGDYAVYVTIWRSRHDNNVYSEEY